MYCKLSIHAMIRQRKGEKNWGKIFDNDTESYHTGTSARLS
jgi:hypothetical protein